ncbi:MULTISPECIES: hypothetical protein, partial [unclassified Streptomyces]|uniref:FitA-like ribbon-helix-helix domain-containing protein n=1 Tax=unclassified Streptomyces TaxID=2593676 RepID=UPI001C40779D
MTALTIRDVPESALAILKARAAQAGKSLQAYTLELLVGAATTAARHGARSKSSRPRSDPGPGASVRRFTACRTALGTP